MIKYTSYVPNFAISVSDYKLIFYPNFSFIYWRSWDTGISTI
jgi:hypothetical protein